MDINTSTHSSLSRPLCGADCTTHHYGHQMHWLHADVALYRERVWLPISVTRVEGGEVLLRDPVSGRTVHAWHHMPLTGVIEEGQQGFANIDVDTLVVGRNLINVKFTGSFGPVDVDRLVTFNFSYAIDLTKGRGLTLDPDEPPRAITL